VLQQLSRHLPFWSWPRSLSCTLPSASLRDYVHPVTGSFRAFSRGRGRVADALALFVPRSRFTRDRIFLLMGIVKKNGS